MEKRIGLGRWEWLHKHVHAIAVIAAFFGGPALGLAVEALDQIVNDRQTVHSTYQPTDAENKIINDWFDKKFTPWLTILFKEYHTAFESSNEFIGNDKKIVVANSILRKMEAIDTFFHTKENVGLSEGALAVRLELTGKIFDTITDTMREDIINVHLVMVKDQAISSITGYETIITDKNSFIGMRFSYPKFVTGAGVDFPGEPVVVVTPPNPQGGGGAVVVVPPINPTPNPQGGGGAVVVVPPINPTPNPHVGGEIVVVPPINPTPNPNDIVKELDNTPGKILIGIVLLTLYLLISKKSKK